VIWCGNTVSQLFSPLRNLEHRDQAELASYCAQRIKDSLGEATAVLCVNKQDVAEMLREVGGRRGEET
jgi:hypothetical protein